MSAEKTLENMVGGWMDTQQKLWQDWMEMLRAGPSGEDLWTRTVDHWETSVHKALEAESESVRAWAEGLEHLPGTPDEVKRWAGEGCEVVRRWSEAQRQLWDQWFAMVRKAATMMPPGGQSPEKLVQAWQDAARQMMETQQRWAAGGAGKSAGSDKAPGAGAASRAGARRS